MRDCLPVFHFQYVLQMHNFAGKPLRHSRSVGFHRVFESIRGDALTMDSGAWLVIEFDFQGLDACGFFGVCPGQHCYSHRRLA